MLDFFLFLLSIISAAAIVFSGFVAAYSEQFKLVGAFIVGALGSVAYITALYFKFIGLDDESRSIIMGPFLSDDSKKVSVWKSIWYGLIGGGIAVVFQFDVPNFVAIQSLIIGITWPAVVAQFLSGRLISPTRSEKEAQELFKNASRSHVPTSEQVLGEISDLLSQVRKTKKSKGKK